MDVTTKFLIRATKAWAFVLLSAVIIRLDMISLIGDIIAVVFNFQNSIVCYK